MSGVGGLPEFPTPAPPPEGEGGPGRLAHLAARIRRNPTLLSGLALLGAFAAAAVVAMLHYGDGRNLLPTNQGLPPGVASFYPIPPGPTWSHPFGIDAWLGVDVLSGILRATPNDLALVGAILLGAAVLGLLLGGWSGLTGGWLDLLAVGAADLLIGVPPFFLVVVLYLGAAPLVTPSELLPLFAALFALVLWPYYARPVRAVAQRVTATGYVEAARASGAGTDRLLFRHVLPNSLYPVLAQLPIDVFNVFFVLSVFPFVGCFGGGAAFAPISITPYPLYPEWGSMLGYGTCYGWSVLPQLDAWWSYLFPGAVIVAFGFMVVLLCDGLERHLGVGPRR